MAGYLLQPTESRVPGRRIYPRTRQDLIAQVEAHYEHYGHLAKSVPCDVELFPGTPARGRIHQNGLPRPLVFTLTRKD